MSKRKQVKTQSRWKTVAILAVFALLTTSIKAGIIYFLSRKLTKDGFPLGLVDSDYDMGTDLI